MSMSKREFEAIANVLRGELRRIEALPEEDRDAALYDFNNLKGRLANTCYASNNNFDRNRFDSWIQEYEYIGYAQREMPGDISFDLYRFRNESEALGQLRALEAGTGDQWSMSLYGYSPENWWDAKDFESTGCPFDYPRKVSKRGPRGGLKFEVA